MEVVKAMVMPKMMFRIAPKQQTPGVYEMYLYDDVTARGKFDWSSWTEVKSETSAKYFRDKLAEIPNDAVINLYINSNGGDVQEGVGIYNQLKRHGAVVNGYVDGNAYSVAFLILMACDHKVMNLGTSALLHNMWMECRGNAKTLRAYADTLDKLMESNRQVFLEACGNKITEEQLIQMMEEETFLTPDECLVYGFIDEVGRKQAEPEDPEDPENPEDPEGPEDPENPQEPDKEEELSQRLRGIGLMALKEQARKRQEFIRIIQDFAETSKPKEYSNASKFFEKFL